MTHLARAARAFLGLALLASAASLAACNTTAGVGKDVSSTGNAVSRGANDVKNGL